MPNISEIQQPEAELLMTEQIFTAYFSGTILSWLNPKEAWPKFTDVGGDKSPLGPKDV